MSDQSQQLIAKQNTEDSRQTCFVIMPISDHTDYSAGHFNRVYEHIIKPACTRAGFIPDRADDAHHTHVIMMNILQRILDADIVLCDLSTKNPNVLYELGIRQAFDKPVTLIKDDLTSRIFDTGMLSDVEYSADLRIDNVQQAVETIAVRLRNTFEKKDEQVNSLIKLLKIQPAKMPTPTTISGESTIILEAIATLGQRISALEVPALSQKGAKKEKPEYFAASRNFNIRLRSVNEEQTEAYRSLFTESYPTASSSITNTEDGLTLLQFTFNEKMSVHIPTLDTIDARIGIHRAGSGIGLL